ncbi:hypothetical protein L1887_55774 [Cichorium endivia]|nr:hypothetical protein L1887_55774 [Cichorium endivia]
MTTGQARVIVPRLRLDRVLGHPPRHCCDPINVGVSSRFWSVGTIGEDPRQYSPCSVALACRSLWRSWRCRSPASFRFTVGGYMRSGDPAVGMSDLGCGIRAVIWDGGGRCADWARRDSQELCRISVDPLIPSERGRWIGGSAAAPSLPLPYVSGELKGS